MVAIARDARSSSMQASSRLALRNHALRGAQVANPHAQSPQPCTFTLALLGMALTISRPRRSLKCVFRCKDGRLGLHGARPHPTVWHERHFARARHRKRLERHLQRGL